GRLLLLPVMVAMAVALVIWVGAAQADTIDGVTVTALDGSGTAIDIPYYSQGGLRFAGPVDDGSGTGTYILRDFLDAPYPLWEAADGGNERTTWTFVGGIGSNCGSMAWPFHTQGPESLNQNCWDGGLTDSSLTPAIWVVRAPLTATDGSGHALIFDRWTGP